MSKKMLIDATHAEETRVVVVEGNKVDEFDFESLNKRQLAGNIYLAKVTRVEPSLQAAFVDYGGNRHGFLAFNEIHPDYYQIPVADREKLLAEEAVYAKALAEEDAKRAEQPKSRSRRRKKPAKASTEGSASNADAVIASDVVTDDVIDVESPESDLVEVPENTQPVDDASDATALETKAEVQPVKAEKLETEEPEASEKSETDSDDSTDDSEDDTSTEETVKEGIESVADDDVSEEVRPRKPRLKRYKIQEVIKVRQILLIQVVKEERGNKGAALTTYLSLAGRYCVLMPNTARGGGISRKITNAADRKKIKAIANDLIVPEGAGLIIRTAGASRNATDINRDYEFLTRQWEQIRELTLKSIAPAPIYEEGNLIKRSIRDLYTRDIDEIFIEGERGFKAAKEYMKMFMPNRVDKVKQYKEPMPLFSRYQVESHLGAMFNPTVQLKSGGYLVIGITEALVAVDVNSGKATKESSIENTALKTNLEAAEEVARQMRLRDLAGLIVIDFIDMEERRNNTAVEKRLKDKLKNDRARIQVGRISGFGLLEMSRQRLRPGMLEATTQPCPHCHATGLLRSDDSLALSILRELEEEGVRKRSREVLVKAPISVANYLLNEKREHISIIETRYGLSVRVEADMTLIGTEYSVEKFKTATRFVPQPENAPVSMENISMDSFDEAIDNSNPDAIEEDKPKKKPRRRRGGRGRGKTKQDAETQSTVSADTKNTQNSDLSDKIADKDKGASSKVDDTAKPDAVAVDSVDEVNEKPKKTRVSKTKEKAVVKKEPTKKTTPKKSTSKAKKADDVDATVAAEVTEKKTEKPKTTSRKPRTKAKAVSKKPEVKSDAEVEEKPKAPRKRTKTPVKKAKEPSEVSPPTVEPVAVEAAADVVVVEKPAEASKPKRSGWWSRG